MRIERLVKDAVFYLVIVTASILVGAFAGVVVGSLLGLVFGWFFARRGAAVVPGVTDHAPAYLFLSWTLLGGMGGALVGAVLGTILCVRLARRSAGYDVASRAL